MFCFPKKPPTQNKTACREAYTEPDAQYACNLGCQNQFPFAVQRQEVVRKVYPLIADNWGKNGILSINNVSQLDAMMPKIHLLYPMTLVRGLWEDVMSQAHSLITSSWTFYLQADDGKVVIFQVRKEKAIAI